MEKPPFEEGKFKELEEDFENDENFLEDFFEET